MKKIIVIGIVVLVLASVLIGCRKEEHDISVESGNVAFGQYAEGQELLCLVESEEKAQEIADMYGIQLVSFTNSVATFHTEEDPMAVINMGKEKGYPALELNQVMTID